MILVVRAESADVLDPDVFTALSARSDLPPNELAEAVARQHLGRVDADGAHLWLDPVVLRGAGDAHADGLADMLAYAATRGWVDEHGRVRAHLEAPAS